MRRYWLPPDKIINDDFFIEGDLYHHICNVCRQEVGNKFELLQGSLAYLVQIKEKNNRIAKIQIIESREIPILPKPFLELAISIPKLSTLENVIEKSVELGIKSIRPFYSEFSFLRKNRDDLIHKQKRWDKIIQQATQQSGRGDLMIIKPPVQLEEIMSEFSSQENISGVFAYEGESAQSLGDLRDADLSVKKSVWFFIGSEGGFSDQEVKYFQKFNLQPISMGQQVLRVETACVALTAVLKYKLGQMR